MVNRNLIRHLENDQDLIDEITTAIEGTEAVGLDTLEPESQVIVNKIVDGHVIRVDSEFVLVDIGYKSEGSIPISEWEEEEEQPEIGQTIQILVEDIEDAMGRTDDPHGMITLSKKKAQKILDWQQMMQEVEEGQVVTGNVVRKIKGGLLVDIGVNVFCRQAR